jgi:hypothetical protein
MKGWVASDFYVLYRNVEETAALPVKHKGALLLVESKTGWLVGVGSWSMRLGGWGGNVM